MVRMYFLGLHGKVPRNLTQTLSRLCVIQMLNPLRYRDLAPSHAPRRPFTPSIRSVQAVSGWINCQNWVRQVQFKYDEAPLNFYRDPL